MKKLLLIPIFAFAACFSNAQPVCTPDTQTVAGVYPDSTTGLPDATVNSLYALTVTVVVAKDTTGNFPIIGQATIDFDSIIIKNWNSPSSLNLPPGLTGVCEPYGCAFAGGTKGCLFVTGTVTNPADTGVYNLTLDLMVKFKNVPILGTYTLDDGTEDADINDDYTITVKLPAGVNSKPLYIFSGVKNTPNPFTRNTLITYTNSKSGNVEFNVFNMLGEKVYSEICPSVEGINKIGFVSGELPTGIYSYSLNNGENTLSKRMILLGK